MPPLITGFYISLWIVTGLSSLFTILGFFGQFDWRLDLFSHFRTQYASVLFGCSLLFLISRQPVGLICSLIFLVLNLATVLPLYSRHVCHPGSKKVYRVLFANLLGPNTDYTKIQQSIEKAQADMVLLVEVRPNHVQALDKIINGYAHKLIQPDDHNFGMALLSHLAYDSADAVTFDEICTPTIIARFTLNGVPFTLLGIHTFPPKSRAMAARRDHQLALTAAFTNAQRGELLLMGDLNSTPWSHSFKQLIKASRLRNSLHGFGFQASWPIKFPPLGIPIDHALHTPGVCITARRLGHLTGSDHLPLILDFTFTDDHTSDLPG